MEEKKLTISEINDLVESFNHNYQALFGRMDSDFDLWTLKSFELDKYADNITFNEPRVFADAVMQILETAKLTIAIHRKDKDEDKEAKIERFLIAVFDSIDEQLINRGLPTLKSYSIWTACLRGMIAGRFLYRDRPEGLPYDPRWLAYEMDSTGPCWSAYQMWRSPYALKQEYGKSFKAFPSEEKKYESVKVTDFWGKKQNSILVGATQETIEPASDETHKLGKPPVVITTIGSSPMIMTRDDNYTYVSNWCESIYAGGRSMYKELSKILSIWMSTARKSREPSGFVITPDNKLKISDSPYGRSQWTTLPDGSQVYPLSPPDVASSFPVLFDKISEAIQRSDFVWARYSMLTGSKDVSNVLFENMKATADRVLVPILSGLDRYYKQASRLLIEQYIKVGGGIMVEGIDSKGKQFRDEITPEDLMGDYSIDVKHLSVTPEEEAANIARAQMLKQSQFAPDTYIRREVIKFSDSAGMEDDKRVEEAELLSPRIKLTRTIKSLEDKGKPEEAGMMQVELNKLIVMEQQQFGIGEQQGQPASTPEQNTTPPSQPTMPAQPGGE